MRKRKRGREEESEGESESENDMLKILPPGGGNTKSRAAAAGVSPLSSAVAMVQADYLNRVNAAASPASLDELAGFVEAMGPDCCRRAFDIALDERITRWSYIRGILQDKQQRGVKCLADWNALDNRRRERGGNGRAGPISARKWRVPHDGAGDFDGHERAQRRLSGLLCQVQRCGAQADLEPLGRDVPGG